MIVVPLEKDIVTTLDDGLEYSVISYSNFKDAGPAVYCRPRTQKAAYPSLVYFFDIATINGTRVEYSKATKMLTALGRLERKQQLPQQDDKVTTVDSEGQEVIVDVQSLQLQSRILGTHKGIFIKDKGGNNYRLKDISAIDTAIGSDQFDAADFVAIYSEYLGA